MTNNQSAPLALCLTDITKVFGREIILDHVNFSLKEGEICCLMGENGAGKTTLMRIISGLLSPDSGQIQVRGQRCSRLTPSIAHQLGIYLVPQQPELVPMLSVEDNVFLGRELTRSCFLNHTEQQRQLEETFHNMGWALHPSQQVSSLSPLEQRLVDVARALTGGARILILDELSAFANGLERKKVHDLIRRLSLQGLAIIYISHDLEECQQLSQRLVILKFGRILDEYSDSRLLSPCQLISNLTDHLFLNRYPRTNSERGPVVLQTQKLCTKTGLKHISMHLRQGEIVGIIGIEGSGQNLLFQVLTGTQKPSSGQMQVNGMPVQFSSATDAAKAGIASISTEINDNLFLEMDSYFNVSISNLKRITHSPLIGPGAVQKSVQDHLLHLGFHPGSLHKSAAILSQGQKQKVALAKMMFCRKNIYIMNNPSINLDTPSRVELYNAINWLAHKKQSVLLFSSNPEELVGMCDRIYLMKDGQITGESSGRSKSVSSIMLHLTAP